jgi:hypothetical protein
MMKSYTYVSDDVLEEEVEVEVEVEGIGKIYEE